MCELPNLLEQNVQQDFQVVAAAFAVLSPDPEARGDDWVHHFLGFLQFRFFRLLQMNFRSFCRTCAWKNMEERILNGTIWYLHVFGAFSFDGTRPCLKVSTESAVEFFWKVLDLLSRVNDSKQLAEHKREELYQEAEIRTKDERKLHVWICFEMPFVSFRKIPIEGAHRWEIPVSYRLGCRRVLCSWHWHFEHSTGHRTSLNSFVSLASCRCRS